MCSSQIFLSLLFEHEFFLNIHL